MSKGFYCIGDSHALEFVGVDRRDKFAHLPTCQWQKHPEYELRGVRVGPVLAFNLPSKMSLIDGVLGQVPPGSNVGMYFGEIDCRAHILIQSVRQRVSISAIAESCVAAYMRVASILLSRGYQVYAIGISPPNGKHYCTAFPSHGTIQQRTEIIEKYNDALKDSSNNLGINYISAHASISASLQGNSLLSVNESNTSEGIVNHFFIDAVHLRSSSFVPIMLTELQRFGVTL
jgi:hypothetical protein